MHPELLVALQRHQIGQIGTAGHLGKSWDVLKEAKFYVVITVWNQAADEQ